MMIMFNQGNNRGMKNMIGLNYYKKKDKKKVKINIKMIIKFKAK